MKLVYIVIDEFDVDNKTGVSQKIFAKVNSFKLQNINITLLALKKDFSNSLNHTINLQNDIVEYTVGLKNAFTGRLNRIKADRYFYSEVANFMKTNNFDYILFRYPGASIGLNQFTKEFKGKIYFEHNTIEVSEFKLYERKKKHIKFNLRPSPFFYWFQEKKLDVLAEKYLAPSILKNAGGGICITSEIAEHEKSKFNKYKTIITGNGFDFNSIKFVPKQFNKDDKLIIGFVVSSNLPWFGIERLIKSLKASKSSLNFEIRIAGMQEDKSISHPKIKYLGYLNREDLIKFYSDVHVTLGPLALYKKGLEYASALKIKESMAYGVPFIIGYKEEGINDNNLFKNYFLELSNNDEIIDFDKIAVFVETFYENKNNQFDLCELGKKHFDTEIITKKILNGIKN